MADAERLYSELSRSEFECEIPLADAEKMMETMCPFKMEKWRYPVRWGGSLFEIDVFLAIMRLWSSRKSSCPTRMPILTVRTGWDGNHCRRYVYQCLFEQASVLKLEKCRLKRFQTAFSDNHCKSKDSLYILISAFFVPLFPINLNNLKSRHSRAGGNPVL